MSYYTTYELEIIENIDENVDYEKEISEIVGYNPFEDISKWYDHENIMKEFSEKHPNTLFKLIGTGEDNDDMWHIYFRNGKMQRIQAEIVFAEFEEDLLK
jgi:hypothetical protein